MRKFFLVLILLSYVLMEISANGHHGRGHRRHHNRSHHNRDHDWEHKEHHERGHHRRNHHDDHRDHDDDRHHRRHGRRHHRDHDDDRHHRRHGRNHHRDHDDRWDHFHQEHYERRLNHLLGKLLNKWERKAYHDRFHHNEWDYDPSILGQHWDNEDHSRGQTYDQEDKDSSNNQEYHANSPSPSPSQPSNYNHQDDDEEVRYKDPRVNDQPQPTTDIPDDNSSDNDTVVDTPQQAPTDEDEPKYQDHNDQDDDHNNVDKDDSQNKGVKSGHYKSSNPGVKGEGVLAPIKEGKSETGANQSGGDETVGLVDQAPILPTKTENHDLGENNLGNNDNSTGDIPVPGEHVKTKEQDSSWVLGLAIGVPVGIIALALIVVGILLYKRKQSLIEVEIDVPEKGWVTHT